MAGEPLPKAHMSPEQTGRMKRTVDYRTDLDSRCGGVVPRTHGEGAPAATLELPLG